MALGKVLKTGIQSSVFFITLKAPIRYWHKKTRKQNVLFPIIWRIKKNIISLHTQIADMAQLVEQRIRNA